MNTAQARSEATCLSLTLAVDSNAPIYQSRAPVIGTVDDHLVRWRIVRWRGDVLGGVPHTRALEVKGCLLFIDRQLFNELSRNAG